MKITLPTFLGIGAQRAGTTWLYNMLSRHREIFISAQKELHFFDEKPDISDYNGFGNLGKRNYRDMSSPMDWQWYQMQFEKGKNYECRGEITPYYAVLSEQRVALIAQRLPSLKAIYILRNPVLRAWSGFRLLWFTETKNRRCNLEIDMITKSIMHPTQIIHGNYKRNIGIWEKYVGIDRILYLFYDDIIKNPQNVLHQVCAFLGVGELHVSTVDMKKRINTADFDETDMLSPVRAMLEDYYAEQISYIKQRFNRTLEY